MVSSTLAGGRSAAVKTGGTPCSSAATMNSARIGSTAPFMVIDTLIWSSGMPENNVRMS